MNKKYKYLLAIAPSVFILDQVTKWLTQKYISIGEGIAIIPGYFDLVHITNKGAAFGMLSDTSSTFRNPFFCIVAVIALIFISYMFAKLKEKDACMVVPLSLVVGGIFGNILDRLRLGAVVDFLSIHIQDRVLTWNMLGNAYNVRLSWPAFNVADSAITVAMVILIWCMLTKKDTLE